MVAILVGIGEIYDVHKQGRNKITSEQVLRAFGLGLLLVVILIGFGVASWLIPIAFHNGARFLWWVSGKTHIPFLVWFLIWPIILVFASFAIGYLRRLWGKGKE